MWNETGQLLWSSTLLILSAFAVIAQRSPSPAFARYTDPPAGPWTYYDEFPDWESAVGPYQTFDFMPSREWNGGAVNEEWASEGLHLASSSDSHNVYAVAVNPAGDPDGWAITPYAYSTQGSTQLLFDTEITAFAWLQPWPSAGFRAYSHDGTIAGWVVGGNDGLGGVVFDVPVHRIVVSNGMIGDVHVVFVPGPSAAALALTAGLLRQRRRP